MGSLGDYAVDVQIRELVGRHDLVLRNAAHELGAGAFRKEVGTYPAILASLIKWARGQEERAAR